MPPSASAQFEKWNRKIHYYLGLYLLFFLWLFLLTGLMLNHGSWPVARTAVQRREARFERPITVSRAATDIERVRDYMDQFGITGDGYRTLETRFTSLDGGARDWPAAVIKHE